MARVAGKKRGGVDFLGEMYRLQEEAAAERKRQREVYIEESMKKALLEEEKRPWLELVFPTHHGEAALWDEPDGLDLKIQEAAEDDPEVHPWASWNADVEKRLGWMYPEGVPPEVRRRADLFVDDYSRVCWWSLTMKDALLKWGSMSRRAARLQELAECCVALTPQQLEVVGWVESLENTLGEGLPEVGGRVKGMVKRLERAIERSERLKVAYVCLVTQLDENLPRSPSAAAGAAGAGSGAAVAAAGAAAAVVPAQA